MVVFGCDEHSVSNDALSRTCEARGPGDVQVEVLGGVNEHVKVPVGLRREEMRKDSQIRLKYQHFL